MSKADKKLLMRIYRKKTVPYSEHYELLITYGYVVYQNMERNKIGENVPIKDYINISEKGIAHIESERKERFRYYFPIMISIVSLLLSIASIIINQLS